MKLTVIQNSLMETRTAHEIPTETKPEPVPNNWWLAPYGIFFFLAVMGIGGIIQLIGGRGA